MDRSVLSDEQFERVAPHLPGKVGDPGRTANNRLFLEGVFWIARTGAPWRDLGPRFGLWNSVYRRFRRWAEKGVFESLFKLLSPTRTSNTPSSTAPSSGSTSMAPAQGGTQNQAIGRSRGGLTTKIVALVDALGNLTRFLLLPGQRHDSIGVAPLIEGIDFEALLADKAFDIDWIRAELDSRGAMAVIPPKADRVRSIPCDFAMYKWRHLVENLSAISSRSGASPRDTKKPTRAMP